MTASTSGSTTSVNVESAKSILTQQAEEGTADAQLRLGECLLFGWGMDRDLSQAEKWLLEAQQNGHCMASQRLVELLGE